MNQIIECYKDMWVNWKNFSGRTRRSGYWYAFLANFIVAFVLGLLSGVVPALTVLTDIYSILVLVPSIALAVRRLHDTGHSGWWYLIVLTGIGAIVLLVWFCQDSQPDNKFGPSPKGYHAAAPAGYPGAAPAYPTYPTYPQGPQAPQGQAPQAPQAPQNTYNKYDNNGPELK